MFQHEASLLAFLPRLMTSFVVSPFVLLMSSAAAEITVALGAACHCTNACH